MFPHQSSACISTTFTHGWEIFCTSQRNRGRQLDPFFKPHFPMSHAASSREGNIDAMSPSRGDRWQHWWQLRDNQISLFGNVHTMAIPEGMSLARIPVDMFPDSDCPFLQITLCPVLNQNLAFTGTILTVISPLLQNSHLIHRRHHQIWRGHCLRVL